MKALLALVCLLFAAAVPAADYKIGDRLAPAQSTAATKAREISWDDLMPPGWNPAKELEGLDLDRLDDADPRAMEVLARLKQMWANAPSNPAITGKPIRLPGFMVPLEYGKKEVSEFLLVPYFGACIHVPPPPANQIIHVLPAKPVKMKTYMDAVWIEGQLELASVKTDMGDAGYRLRAVKVEPYVEKKPRR
jgi:hypothetical protein